LDDVYGRIARRYDLVNSLQSFGLAGFVRRNAARFINRGVVLDIGAGSGDLAAACLAAGARRVVCLDRSPEMFEVARRKLARYERAGRVVFVLGDVTRLPFRDGVFDGAGSAFVFRNIPDVETALREVRRVTGEDGRVAMVDVFAPPSGLVGLGYKLYLNIMVPLWGYLVARDREAYQYLSSSIQRCFSGADLARGLTAAGFGLARAEPKFLGVAHVVKAQPSR
jgi:demethylmenaquinone methyltransferase/2-methoxy-6-polyprenyl-1,4-benzoquinol methylase